MNLGMIFFVIYLIVVAWLAWLGQKKTTDVSSFAVGKGDVHPFLAALTFAATFCSAGTFLGLTGQAYATGTPVLWFTMGQWFPAMLGLAIMAKGYRVISDKMKSLSIADWIGDRYNSNFLRVFVALVTLLNITYVGAQFVGVGIIMNTILGVPYFWGVVIGIGVVICYIFMGGTYAHIYTNVFQGAMMVIIAVAIFLSGFKLFPNFFTEIPAKLAIIDPNLANPLNPKDPAYATPIAIIGIFVAHFFWSANPHLINKVQYLKGKTDIRRFILYTSLFMFLIGIVTFGGLYARILAPGLETPDAAIPTFVNMIFPPAISALFLIVLIAATMSTTDGLMVYLATVFGNTIYKQTIMKHKERRGEKVDYAKVDKMALEISRWAVILVGLLAMPVAWKQPKFLIVLLWTGSCGVLSTVAGPIIMGIWSKRANTTAAIISAIGGLLSYLVLYFGKITLSVYLAGAQGATIGLVIMVIASYLTKPMPEEFNSKFFVK